ncbi:nudC domain-containing protein 3 [Achroia grisella]|uniref:nudC domain-containing protein 3 n=1 Tax=Achroia grisella TaxID=688607 RepID=UPI0027D2D962|nr:nudC domain-containing protein 3 [Achroia grisella]
MSQNFDKYDDALSSILVKEESILGFLSAIFNFLARRTDFYLVPDGPYENIGFPPGVAEELVLKVLRKCDPKNYKPNGRKPDLNSELNNEIMCSTVAQEVEVIADDDEKLGDNAVCSTEAQGSDSTSIGAYSSENPTNPDEYIPPKLYTQNNSDTYNGADRGVYCWSQTIMELDVIVKLPPDVKTSKDIKVTINAGDICAASRSGDIIIKDTLPYKIKAIDSFWSISERKLHIHLEKVQERWWDKLLNDEEPIDLSRIDCSRPLNELPEDHVDKVRELQWNQEQKRKGLPTSEEIRNMELLKKAWNAPGSPFSGKEFDPKILNQSLLNSFPEQ